MEPINRELGGTTVIGFLKMTEWWGWIRSKCCQMTQRSAFQATWILCLTLEVCIYRYIFSSCSKRKESRRNLRCFCCTVRLQLKGSVHQAFSSVAYRSMASQAEDNSFRNSFSTIFNFDGENTDMNVTDRFYCNKICFQLKECWWDR